MHGRQSLRGNWPRIRERLVSGGHGSVASTPEGRSGGAGAALKRTSVRVVRAPVGGFDELTGRAATCKPLEIRFRWKRGKQQYFCLNNRTLHLTDRDFRHGTFEAGQLLAPMCREFCVPQRSPHQPCPAFVSSHKIGTENLGLATVDFNSYQKWEECAGVRALLDLTETLEERVFLLNYLDENGGAESQWRTNLVASWNAAWNHVDEGWAAASRRGKFDQMIWWTFRFPALVPQVWLNWLHMASAEDQRALEEKPSRVDFVAFHNGQGHIVEIDGPSHYANYDSTTHSYAVNDRAYAKTLKIWRSLKADGWQVHRLRESRCVT